MPDAAVRVALLSDTHGALDPRVAAEVARCDVAVHAGDLGNAAVIDALEAAAGTLIAVRGNNDLPGKWPAGEGPRLAALAWEAELDLPGGRLVVVHGDRAGAGRERHRRLRERYPFARMVVYGHSHRLCIDREAAPAVVNPGAAGRARTYGGPSCCILHAAPRGWALRALRFVPGGTPAVERMRIPGAARPR